MSYLLGQFGTVRSVSCLSISGCFCPVQSNLSKATSDLAAGQRTLVKHQHSSNPSHASSSKLSTHASFTFTLFKLTLVFQVDVAESPLIYIYIYNISRFGMHCSQFNDRQYKLSCQVTLPTPKESRQAELVHFIHPSNAGRGTVSHGCEFDGRPFSLFTV